jgi:thiol-disulfide isomerase/thioredoxin
MKIRIKYLLYIAVLVIAMFILLNFLVLNNAKSGEYLSVGETAPNYTFQLANGSTQSLSSYSGKPLILWFVATWCSSCAQGNTAVAENLGFFKEHNVKIVELEQYNDLGSAGMSISKFISEYGNNNTYITGGIASYNMTLAYNTPPSLQLDIYYLISPNGKILNIGEGIAGGIGNLENTILKDGL